MKNELGQDSSHINSFRRWFKNFTEAKSILDHKRLVRPSIDGETVDAVYVAFHHSPRESIHVASNQFSIPQSTVLEVFINDFGSMLTNYQLFKL